jgi:hypothetical protein
MTALGITFTAWAILTAGFVALMVYRGHLTQHETDQLFLSENASHNSEEEHDDIVRRVNSLQPLLKGFGGAAAISTIALIGLYVLGTISAHP